MQKIWLIIKREYFTRVRKKSFLISTLLVPVLLVGLMIVPIVLANRDDNNDHIAVVDESNLFNGKLADGEGVYYKYIEHTNIDTFKNTYSKQGYSGVLFIPALDIERPGNIDYYSKGQPGVGLQGKLNRDVNRVIENNRMEKAGINQEKLDGIRSHISINTITESGKKGSSEIAFAIGYASGFIIYIVLILFGMQVMRGVTEEKTSRIAEVMISSVKPFQLMMGKILGIAGVGLTQFIIWIVLIVGLYTLALPALLGADGAHAVQQSAAASNGQSAAMIQVAEQLQRVATQVNWSLIAFCFLFYFVGGYLFYASLFAAVGSLVNEDANDAQSMTFPITLPIIVGLMIMFASVKNPGSTIAVWGSIIPFTSPIVMMARLPYGVPGTVPYWQLALSFIFLIAGFLGTTWAAGKIYRTGILMYGKKITWGEAMKWVTRKG